MKDCFRDAADAYAAAKDKGDGVGPIPGALARRRAGRKSIPGPPQQPMTPELKREIVDLIRRGAGRQAAMRRLAVHWRVFGRECRDDPEFAHAVKQAEAIKVEAVTSVVFKKAVREKDVPAAKLFLDQSARVANAVAASRAQREARRAAADGLPESVAPLVDRAVGRVISLSMQFVPPERVQEFVDAVTREFGGTPRPQPASPPMLMGPPAVSDGTVIA